MKHHLLFALLLLLLNVVTGEQQLQQAILRDAPSCDRKLYGNFKRMILMD